MTTATSVDVAPLFTCRCHEPSGVVERSVYPMPITRDNLLKFWEKSRRFKTLFDGEVTDFKSFCEMFMSMDENDHVQAHGLFWVIDDFVGVFYMTHIRDNDAQIHYTFLDRRHHGRQAITRKMIQYVFNKYKFRRLSAEIPFFAQSVYPFVMEVGLKMEGRRRKGAFMDGEWFDVKLFGVLREEADAWG